MSAYRKHTAEVRAHLERASRHRKVSLGGWLEHPTDHARFRAAPVARPGRAVPTGPAGGQRGRREHPMSAGRVVRVPADTFKRLAVHAATVTGATAKRVRRRNWNRELGPWGNGFDHGWADALAGRHLPAMSAKAPDQSPEAREAYTAAYHEAVAILREGGES